MAGPISDSGHVKDLKVAPGKLKILLVALWTKVLVATLISNCQHQQSMDFTQQAGGPAQRLPPLVGSLLQFQV